MNTFSRLQNKAKITRLNVLMNGPSLSKDVELIDNSLSSLAVNQFSTTEFFEKIARFLCLLDYYYWSSNVMDEYVRLRQEAFDALNKYTTWPMTLYIPSFADINYIRDMIKSPYIKVRSFLINPLFLVHSLLAKILILALFFFTFGLNRLLSTTV